ncbi:hypothetical protein [Aliiroseovarius sp. YM-037]|uniref:hypothetical protein n=1 Tax=Aliiroseovarius sp. YM-037 TaxID=3341728 RepID=UPI003A7FEFD5
MPLSTKNIVEGIVGGAILAAGSYFFVQYWNRETPQEQFKNSAFELLTRAASAEGLLRASCISDQVAVTEAYWNLVAPRNAQIFPRDLWVELDEELADESAFSIAHRLAVTTDDYSGSIYPASDIARVFGEIRIATLSLQDNYNPTALEASAESTDWKATRHQMGSLLRENFSAMQESRAGGVEGSVHFSEGMVLDRPPSVTAVIVSSKALDQRNEGYWWSTCNQKVFECANAVLEKDNLALAFNRIREIDSEVATDERLGNQSLRDGYASPFLMSAAFFEHLSSRNFVSAGADGDSSESYNVSYEQCTELFFDLFPVDLDDYETALEVAVSIKRDAETNPEDG